MVSADGEKDPEGAKEAGDLLRSHEKLNKSAHHPQQPFARSESQLFPPIAAHNAQPASRTMFEQIGLSLCRSVLGSSILDLAPGMAGASFVLFWFCTETGHSGR